MSRIAYVNGQYVPHGEAAVHIEDRGYQFADGVYEVIPIVNGKMIGEQGHMDRLWRSMDELQMDAPMAPGPMKIVMREVLRQNKVETGLIYIQVTRGVAPRDHPFPLDAVPSLVMTAKKTSMDAADAKADKGVSVITTPDIRWNRCDIKSVALLPNVLAKQAAKEQGAYEAFQYDADGNITEGSSTNAWIVDQDGTLITRPTSNSILAGITRAELLDLLEKEGIKVELRAFSKDELMNAREVFLTSSSSYVQPVVEVDGKVIGNGKPGSISSNLRGIFKSYMQN
ncbi:D-amino-acid transaminase [Sneathiella sp. P13V-1]|uniref:D-amino-acid transaminase n=1 Tax=Sneathiella sp. P13V-1 TaxID=2697366 RepID=UPI00187B32D2|nr:D-amino-acid transaminase [Sneathiella sp. P13V-1]MBE7637329.1 D-amino-acid transaminase [Sneathiella sp. P13V-1]